MDNEAIIHYKKAYLSEDTKNIYIQTSPLSIFVHPYFFLNLL